MQKLICKVQLRAKRVCIALRMSLDDDVNCFLGRLVFKDIREVVRQVKLYCRLDLTKDDWLSLARWSNRDRDAP